MKTLINSFFLITSLFFLLSQSMNAQWSADPAANKVLTNSDGNTRPEIVSDGVGGSIIIWADPQGNDILGQRLDACGNNLWTNYGVNMFPNAGWQWEPVIVSDGEGGVIIVYGDNSGGIGTYAQRFNSNGAYLWPASAPNPKGVLVNGNTHVTAYYKIVSDGAHGVIVIWNDLRSTTHWEKYASRFDESGNLLWGDLAICTVPGLSDFFVSGIPPASSIPNIVADGNGGAYITWKDDRTIMLSISMHQATAFGLPHRVF
jgi:hypothetical protein